MIELQAIIDASYAEWIKGKDGKKRIHPSPEVYAEIFRHMFPYAAAAYAATLQREQQPVVPDQVITVTSNIEEGGTENGK